MALRKRPIAAGIAALLFSGYISALGLGEIRLNSSLNEPLDAEIPLINLGELSESELIAGLASAKDFSSAGVDREPILTSLVFRLDVTAPGGPVLRVLSNKPIREPYLDFLVDVQWPSGRVLREYTLLLDLPVFAGGSAKKNVEAPLSRPSRAPSSPAPTRSASPLQAQPQQPVVPSDQEYVVRDGDTLWRIASSLGTNAGVHEKMAGIYQLNPNAFIDGDMNLLKRGAVLRLPDYGSGGSQQARQAVSTWGEAAPYAPQLSTSSRDAESRPPRDDGGRLTLSAGEADDVASSALGTQGAVGSRELRGEISSIQEELDRSRRENSELKDRLSSLEQQIATMQRIMEIADDDLRTAQLAVVAEPLVDAVDDSGAAQSTAEPPVEEEDYEAIDSPSLALFPSANVGSSRPRIPTGVDPVYEDSTAAAAESRGAGGDTLAAGAEEAKPVATVAAAEKTEPKTEKGWFEKVKGLLMVLLGLLVVAIGAAVFFVFRRGKSAETDVYSPPVQRQAPPPAPVRERPREQPKEQPRPKAATLDDIALKEEDDLFAQPSSAPKVDQQAVKVAAPRQESLEEMELDLSEFDLDDTNDVAEQSSSPPAAEAAGSLNLDEEFDFLGDIDEGDTQLELAQAYIEMGDHAGAKEILLEVAEGGSDEQKDRARQLLGQIG